METQTTQTATPAPNPAATVTTTTATAPAQERGNGHDTSQDVLNNPQIKSMIDKMMEERMAGIVNNRNQVLEEKKELQKELAQIKKQWEGFDHERVQRIMERIDKDEETKLIADGKLDEVVSRRTERLRADLETQLKAREAKIEELTKAVTVEKEKRARLVIDGSLRAAAVEAGITKTAIEDVVYRGRQVFNLDENDRAIPRDPNGNLLVSKDGITPLSAQEWLDSMKKIAPHWWPPSQGGGAMPGDAGKPARVNPWKKESFNLTQQGMIYRDNPELARELMREAGVPAIL